MRLESTTAIMPDNNVKIMYCKTTVNYIEPSNKHGNLSGFNNYCITCSYKIRQWFFRKSSILFICWSLNAIEKPLNVLKPHIE